MILINPGSGPCAGATKKTAYDNLERFIEELDIDGARWASDPDPSVESDDGRFAFVLANNERQVSVLMPGIPLESDDWTRLYVDGSSWTWMFALSSAKRALLCEDEE